MVRISNAAGFTLVELIVVIAILAILAGVAVPAFFGYLSRAGEATVNVELDALVHAAQAAALLDGVAVEKITVTAEGLATAYSAVAYGDDGQSVLYYIPLDLTSFHPGRLDNLAIHPDFADGCTWTVDLGIWEEGVEELPLASEENE